MLFNYYCFILFTIKLSKYELIDQIPNMTIPTLHFFLNNKPYFDYTELTDWINDSKYKLNKNSMLILDSSKSVLKLIIGQILKQGKRPKLINLFLFFLFNFYQTFQFLLGEELELLIEKDFNLPYSLGKKHSSNKVYYFPRPITEKANWKFFFKAFSKNFKKEKTGQALYNLIVLELVNLIFCDSSIFIFKEIDHFLKHAHDYRMFIHFRWTRRKPRKLPKKIRFKYKKRYRRNTWNFKTLQYKTKQQLSKKIKFKSLIIKKKFYPNAKLYSKLNIKKLRLIGYNIRNPYKLY